ncbi:MAG: preprotein translocase subunit SecG [Clostridia bacterium]|nr:preprotein translocase subunit SecG [Clostridia bacterium]
MSAWEYVIGALIIIFSLIVIAVILLQEGRQSNLGAISGSTDSFMDKGRARTLDAFLARWTKVLAIVFFVLVLAGMLVTYFLGA